MVVPLPPEPPPPVVLLLEPQPEALIAATEMSSARSAPQRRRRGTVMNRTHASAVPEPARYQGDLPNEGGVLRAVEVW